MCVSIRLKQRRRKDKAINQPSIVPKILQAIFPNSPRGECSLDQAKQSVTEAKVGGQKSKPLRALAWLIRFVES